MRKYWLIVLTSIAVIIHPVETAPLASNTAKNHHITYLQKGSSALLHCNGHNGVIWRNNKGLVYKMNYMLILNAQIQNTGFYSCIKNKQILKQYSVKVYVRPTYLKQASQNATYGQCSKGFLLTNNTICIPCVPGSRQSGIKCIPCPKNSFQSQYGSSSCKLCPNNTVTETEGCKRPQECKGGLKSRLYDLLITSEQHEFATTFTIIVVILTIFTVIEIMYKLATLPCFNEPEEQEFHPDPITEMYRNKEFYEFDNKKLANDVPMYTMPDLEHPLADPGTPMPSDFQSLTETFATGHSDNTKRQ